MAEITLGQVEESVRGITQVHGSPDSSMVAMVDQLAECSYFAKKFAISQDEDSDKRIRTQETARFGVQILTEIPPTDNNNESKHAKMGDITDSLDKFQQWEAQQIAPQSSRREIPRSCAAEAVERETPLLNKNWSMPRAKADEDSKEESLDASDGLPDRAINSKPAGGVRLIKYSTQKSVARWLKNHTLSLMASTGAKVVSRDKVKIKLEDGKLKVQVEMPDGEILS